MRSKQFVSVVLAIALSVASPLSNAIGLGESSSLAQINQPLQVDISIISANYEDHYFHAELADRSFHDKLGIVNPSRLPKLYFRTFQTNSGPKLRVTSLQSVKEPIINFLLKIKYQDNTVLKEITIFLDPPQYTTVLNNSQSDDLAHKKHITKNTKITITSANQTTNINSITEDLFITVGNGQSLWRIARKWQVSGMRITDKMEVIYRTNLDAFVANNKNRLKLGARIQVYSQDIAKNTTNIPAIDSSKTYKMPSDFSNKVLTARSHMSILTSNPPKAIIKNEFEPTKKQNVLKTQLREINSNIEYLSAVNKYLKEQIKKHYQTTKNDLASVQDIPTKIVSNNVVSDLNGFATIKTSSIENLVQLSSSSMVYYDTDKKLSGGNWLVIIGMFLSLLLAYAFWIFSRNNKLKYFSKMLDLKFSKLSLSDNETDQAGDTIKKIAIPTAHSSSAQIKYLNSTAEFYIRCERFDLAKELVNESLIQFYNDPIVIKAINAIRIRLFRQLDAHLLFNISSKSEVAIRPAPEMIIDIVDEYELENYSSNDDVIPQDNKY